MIRPAHHRPNVLIAGGGVAALEALLGLRAMADGQIDITLLAPESRFTDRPVTVAEAFDRSEARIFDLGAIAADQDGRLLQASLRSVDLAAGQVETDTGQRLAYDKLVVAVGARQRDPLYGALTFDGPRAVPKFRELLGQLESGAVGSVAFALPSEQLWPLPLYELALLTADHLSAHMESGAVKLVTPETEPLELFGPAATQALETLLAERGIELHRSLSPVAVHPHALILDSGGLVFVDRVVTLPLARGPALGGLPCDESGFIPVDGHGRIGGSDDVFAAGDVTAFPLKQGGLATQQADAVAEQIAADLGIGVDALPFRPVLRGLLMTGGAPVYLRSGPPQGAGHSELIFSAGAGNRDSTVAAGQPLWWPPSKVAGRYLAPYLASSHPQLLPHELTDRVEVTGSVVSSAEQRDAIELALTLAEMDARWGDYRSALDGLAAAEAALGALPPEYEASRRRWRQAAVGKD